LLGSTAIVFLYVFTVGFYSGAFGISLEKLESLLTAIGHFVSFVFVLIMTIFLVKRYSGYLFSGSWKINFYSHLKTGLKWSIPFIFLTGIVVLVPDTRAEWTKIYLLEISLSQENITIGNIIMFSAAMLVATFLEELIFRGMIQQYIKKLVTPRISVLITAGIFTLAHFGEFFINPVSLGKIVFWFLTGIFTGFAFNKANSCISSFIPHLVANLEFIIPVPLMLIL
jgi:membrane protease YdiL (CAAX protease family)